MPGDYDIEYCSPWAGANFLPYDFTYIWNNRITWLIDADSEKLGQPLQNGKKLAGLF